MQLMVRNAMKNPSIKAYRHLIDACLSQPMTLATDINYDKETQVTIILTCQTPVIKPMIFTIPSLIVLQVRHIVRQTSAMSHFYRIARPVLEQHGVVSMESPSLLPRGEETVYKITESVAGARVAAKRREEIRLADELRAIWVGNIRQRGVVWRGQFMVP